MLATKEYFKNVIFVDETTVEMSSNGRIAFYKPRTGLDKLPLKAPKPKHSYKVRIKLICYVLNKVCFRLPDPRLKS